MKVLVFSLLIIFSQILSAEDSKSYNRSAEIGVLSDNINGGSFATIGVSKQYMFNDFTIGMNMMVLMGVGDFDKIGGLTVAPKLGMIFYGSDKSDLFISMFLLGGYSNISNNDINRSGAITGLGVEARYNMIGIDVGYVSIINPVLRNEQIKVALKYCF